MGEESGMDDSAESIGVVVKCGKVRYPTQVRADGTFGDLKRAVEQLSGVPAAHQKLICNKKQCSDMQTLAQLGVRDGSKVAMLVPQNIDLKPPKASGNVSIGREDTSAAPDAAQPEIDWKAQSEAEVEVLEGSVQVVVICGKQKQSVHISQTSTFGDLKRAIASQSSVSVAHQRLICNKKQCSDEQLMSSLGVKDGTKVMLLLSDVAVVQITAHKNLTQVLADIELTANQMTTLSKQAANRLIEPAAVHVQAQAVIDKLDECRKDLVNNRPDLASEFRIDCDQAITRCDELLGEARQLHQAIFK